MGPDAALKKQTLEKCVSSGEANLVVDRDVHIAAQLGITSTPTLFFNGHRNMHVHSQQELENEIRATLGQNVRLQAERDSSNIRRVQ